MMAAGGNKIPKAEMMLFSWRKKKTKQPTSTEDYTIHKSDFLSALNDGDRCFVPLQSSGIPVNIE